MARPTVHGPRLLLAATLLVLLAACSRIADIEAHPRDYAGREVSVRGTVKEVFGLFVVRYFTLDDGSGTIGVVSERPLPQRGEHIRVTGQVREAFALGDRTTLVLVETTPAGQATIQER
jgi:hypothetical protein